MAPFHFDPLSPHKLFNVAQDPREETPLDTELKEYADIVRRMQRARQDHEATLVNAVPTQSHFNLIAEFYNPLRMPFCRFPWKFACKEGDN